MATRDPHGTAKRFDQKIALITGGAGGIGREITRRLIERDIHCLLVDVNGESLAKACAHFGNKVTPFLADLTKVEAVEAMLQFTEKTFGRLDILINNAAITDTARFEVRSVESIIREMNINLISPLVVTRVLMPLLRRTGEGRIINTVSLGGIFPLPETSIYSASKFGLRGAMLCLGLDGPRLGLHVGNILPSATETPMLMKEAIEGGNTIQFADPPQQPADVARQVIRMLDKPALELYPRLSESWSARLAMLWPNLLPKLIPLFRKKGERGHQRYLESLKQRGLVKESGGKLYLDLP